MKSRITKKETVGGGGGASRGGGGGKRPRGERGGDGEKKGKEGE